MTKTEQDPTGSSVDDANEDRLLVPEDRNTGLAEKLAEKGIGSKVEVPDITLPERFRELAESADSRDPEDDGSDDIEAGGREPIRRRSSSRDPGETRGHHEDGRPRPNHRFGTPGSGSHGGYGSGFGSAEESKHVAPSGTTLSDARAHASAGKEHSVDQQRTDDRPEMNTCAVCGRLKPVGREVEHRSQDGGETETKIVLYLVCKSCSDEYNRYRDKAIRAMAQDDDAPEPMDKFRWVYGEIDLRRFEQECVDAKTAYHLIYEEQVISHLENRDYVESTEWNEETGRPYVHFVRKHVPNARALELELRGKEAVKNAFRRMVGTQKRLGVAPQLLEELAARFVAEDSEANGGNLDETPTEPEPVAVGATSGESSDS